MRYVYGVCRYVAALSFAVIAPAAAEASVTVNIIQDGSDVVATTSGSLNLTGMTYVCECGTGAYVWAAQGYLHLGGSGTYTEQNFDGYSGLSGPNQFGSGGEFVATSSTGDHLGLTSSSLFVPLNYSSGSPIANSATWSNETLAGLGLTSGVYTYTLPNDSITLNIGASAVPEPATWALMLTGFGAIGFAMRRRRLLAPHSRMA